MTRPTDDELEAMAVKFQQDHWLDAAEARVTELEGLLREALNTGSPQ